ESLGLAVLERDREEFMAMLDNCLGGAGSALERLDCFFEAALSLHRGRGFVGGCLWGNTALEMSDSNLAFADFVAQVFDEWTDRLIAVIREGQDEGRIRDNVSAEKLAQSVVATIEGGIMLSRLKKDEAPLKGCLDMARLLLLGGTDGE
ncbi:MAG: TetR family transcriptional regulator C-terminal domain-containing protein, partial [Verrucomicrobiota bacterium]